MNYAQSQGAYAHWFPQSSCSSSFRAFFWFSLTCTLSRHHWICSWQTHYCSCLDISESYPKFLLKELSSHSTEHLSGPFSVLCNPSFFCSWSISKPLSQKPRFQHLDCCYLDSYSWRCMRGDIYSLTQISLSKLSEASSVTETHGSCRAGPTDVGWASSQGDVFVSP